MPSKQRKLARDSAILAKLLSEDVVVVDELKFARPRTKDFAAVLGNLKIDRSCLVVIGEHDGTVYKSVRNVPRVDVMPVAQSNAGDICNHKKLLFTREAFVSLLNRDNGGKNG